MRSISIFASLLLSLTAHAQTTAYSIGEIDLITKAQMPAATELQVPAMPATSSEYFALPAQGKTSAELTYSTINGTDSLGDTEFVGNGVGINVATSIAEKLYLSLGAQNQSANANALALGMTKVSTIEQGNVVYGARLATLITNNLEGNSEHEMMAIPFVGFEQAIGSTVAGAELTIEQALVNPAALFMQNAFFETNAMRKLSIGARAGLNQTTGFETGYQAGIYTKYTPIKNTDIRLAIDSQNVQNNQIEEATAITVGIRRIL